MVSVLLKLFSSLKWRRLNVFRIDCKGWLISGSFVSGQVDNMAMDTLIRGTFVIILCRFSLYHFAILVYNRSLIVVYSFERRIIRNANISLFSR